jgi:3-oxoacyl-[acyl-carrier protein] reductase
MRWVMRIVMAGFVPGETMPPTVVEQGRRSAATGSLTTPQDVTNAILFLCSHANGNITGETLRVDGHFLAATA